MRCYAPVAPTPKLVPPIAHFVLLAPSRLQLALSLVSNALAVITALLALLHGLVSIAAEATTVLTALALQRPAPYKCLLSAAGALCKSKAQRSSWKQPSAMPIVSGTSRRATVC